MPRLRRRNAKGGNRERAGKVERLPLQQHISPSVQDCSSFANDAVVQADRLAATIASWQPLSHDPTGHGLPPYAATADHPPQSRPLRWSDVSNISNATSQRLRCSSSSGSGSSSCDGSSVSSNGSTESLSSCEAGGSGMQPQSGPTGSAVAVACAAGTCGAPNTSLSPAAHSSQAASLHRLRHADSPSRMVPPLRRLPQPAAMQRSASLPPVCDLSETWPSKKVSHGGCALQRSLSLPLPIQGSPRFSAAKSTKPRMQTSHAPAAYGGSSERRQAKLSLRLDGTACSRGSMSKRTLMFS